MNSPLLDGIFFDMAGTLLRSGESGVELYPDTKVWFDVCQKREFAGRPIKTGIITNWGARAKTILEHFKIAHLFDVVVCADGFQPLKPAKEVFVRACSEAGVSMENSVFMGDSLYDDALGAQEAGMWSIWIHRMNISELSNSENETISKLRLQSCATLKEAHDLLLSKK